ncbi:nucleopolyhedrovirus P10 family protein [Caldicellulosiruptor changbaiensis]|uniref:Nucleopolyhedrovirus P10 family protein n=1 Tax=Caldicellulosiruptor changbaiensis TaxID=1222016 RepID=A0A3T0D376_9FIRM|nr:nucleopolyhedrovirus P10 family protein [Caldicellulosiruptor changbaiensis]AZT89499.1 nucleopolyhedrovirus P10 family protein [Caldicellulosiruptor changbaiensis]
MSDREILELILQKVETLDQKIDRLEARLDRLETKVESLEKRVENLEKRVDSLEKRVEKLELQVAENTQILKALEHLAQVNKAEHDNFTHQLARMEGLLNSVISNNSKEHQALFKQTEENTQKIVKLEKDMTIIESVCGKNMQDIAFLKGVKI